MKKKKSKVLNKLDNGFKMKLEGLFNRGTKNVISKGNNNQVKKPKRKPIKINFSNTKIGAITPESPKKEKQKIEIKNNKNPIVLQKHSIVKNENNNSEIKKENEKKNIDIKEKIVINKELIEKNNNNRNICITINNKILDKLIELNSMLIDKEIKLIKKREKWYNRHKDKLLLGSIICGLLIKYCI